MLPALRAAIAALVLFGVASGTGRNAASAAEVNLYTTREPGLIKPLLAAYTQATGVQVNTVFLQGGLAERVQAEGARSPADLMIVVDIGNLSDLAKRGLTQPVRSAAVEAAIPSGLRDPGGHWFALSLRARAIMVSKERVPDTTLTYENLADPRWKGRLCLRSGQHPYNTALFAALLAHHDAAWLDTYLAGLKANLARRPAGGDRDVARDILAGQCDVGLANTYYGGLMLSGAGGAEQKRWGEAVRVVLPGFADGGGTHVNVSGAAVARHAPNREEAVKLLEFLTSPAAQQSFAEANFEYPVRQGVALNPIVASFGTLRVDETPLTEIAARREAASLAVDRAGLDR
ncbi:Iron uptake protein A1 [Rhodovastum atsumiense]|uniref:Extracellular solute-binding protein n=1 Tax=Rhodovastum atsumiense TaxID=504468 RepID=A0A5M6IY63_9PROT|nr:extracellular solute-binding protein [Rhodovastum atsumiense]KAA5612305.1 extracellular solute-binding protein [Rhodovastum atsumiense]CAH2601634.1 Iron uptake protein A1 [Rhodovastum atsumiense]